MTRARCWHPPSTSSAPSPAGEHYHKKQEQGSSNDWYVQYSIDLKSGAEYHIKETEEMLAKQTKTLKKIECTRK